MFFSKKKGKQLVLKLTGVSCSSCVMEIDGALEDVGGIIKSETSYIKSQTRVEFNEEEISIEKIVGIVREVGYQVEPLS